MKHYPQGGEGNPTQLVEALHTAQRAAEKAGAIIRARWNTTFQISHKGDVDLVSEVDLAAEKAIVTCLMEGHPQDGIIAEETGAKGTKEDRIWHIDPLDGTTNFSHGIPHFCVSIALVVRGETQVGIIYEPLRDWRFTALKGAGAYWNDSPMKVSHSARLADSLLASGFPYDRRTNPDNNTIRISHLLKKSRGIRRMGSAALDLAYLANGWLDGYWEIRLNSWDVAAGWLLVQEAGGQVSMIDPRLPTANPSEFVASNGRIHQELIHELIAAQRSHHGELGP